MVPMTNSMSPVATGNCGCQLEANLWPSCPCREEGGGQQLLQLVSNETKGGFLVLEA